MLTSHTSMLSDKKRNWESTIKLITFIPCIPISWTYRRRSVYQPMGSGALVNTKNSQQRNSEARELWTCTRHPKFLRHCPNGTMMRARVARVSPQIHSSSTASGRNYVRQALSGLPASGRGLANSGCAGARPETALGWGRGGRKVGV